MAETIEMRKSGPYDPPREKILLAFAEALDAWSDVEAELVIWLGLMTQIPNPSMVEAIFRAVIGIKNQLDMIDAAASVTLKPETNKRFLALTGRARSLSTKRNNLVHGVWRSLHHKKADELVRIEMFREYSREPFGAKPQNMREDAKLRGKTRFYMADIEAATQNFRTLVRDFGKFKEVALCEILPRLY